jgi:hypothetical protein
MGDSCAAVEEGQRGDGAGAAASVREVAIAACRIGVSGEPSRLNLFPVCMFRRLCRVGSAVCGAFRTLVLQMGDPLFPVQFYSEFVLCNYC